MRIASGGIQHETNTFARTPTRLDDFLRDSQCGDDLAGGDIVIQRYAGTNCIHGGYIDAARDKAVELLPLLTAKSQPSGIVEQSAFDTMLGWFLERLRTVMPVDGVLLDLHGAMVTEAHEDAESAFTAAVRELVGDQVPVIVTLDLHANISARLAELANVIIGYDTYPHVDMGERGREMLNLMVDMITGRIDPTQQFRQLPLITMPPMQCTLREPMSSLIEWLHQLEQRPGILTATISMGFPFADITDAGVTCLVTCDNDRDLATRSADELAGEIWKLRDDLQPTLTSIEDVIDFLRNKPKGGLTIFADGSDNPGGGAPCDGTVALRGLLDADFERAVVAVLCDPDVAGQAHEAGVGSSIDVRLGGKTDDRHGAPIEARAEVIALGDGCFRYQGPMLRGVAESMGKTATLQIRGVTVIVSSLRRQCLDTAMLRVAGVEPRDYDLLVVKSAVHYRADFGPLADHIFDADTPGIHRPDFAAYEYQKLRRPIYPLDNVDYRP